VPARRRGPWGIALKDLQPVRAGARGRSQGQALVELSLALPIVLVLIMAIVEFGLGFNALASINFASRQAALTAAKSGNATGSDCLVLRGIEHDISAPANTGNISAVEIFWSDESGNPRNAAVNVYSRTGSTTCLVGTETITVPYAATTIGYPEAARCNVLAGCGGAHVPSVDMIGVKIRYQYPWHTPLRPLLGFLGDGSGFSGAGWSLVQTNAMRMEPTL
jgi:Flp pilus assembly protein TadG